ncbi:MAG: gluconolactonase [Deltaproteobacteria bacterium]|nr:gluconolactonase [Deltaproteobacteria bacterium]MBU53732.1 gluconolactonase [Deltaproteobacteria bacterium]|tara:strand:- start:8851 stop:9981 length:1131 start_codon:yes stop_codon:yes gene_type:complete
MSRKEFFIWLCLLPVVFISFWGGLYWPSVSIHAWTPPKLPAFEGALKRNFRLVKADMLGDETVVEPEDNLVDVAGNMYVSCLDGYIRRIDKQGKTTVFAKTGGRPLGMRWYQKQIIVAVAGKGLLSVSPKGKVSTLVKSFDKKPLLYADDLDITNSGDVYFSDASKHFGIHQTRYDLISRVPSGRLFRYSMKDKKLSLVLDNMYFANGVTLTPKQDAVLVTETGAYRIRKVWISGPKKGTHEIIAKNLPGYPDNIRRRPAGGYWLAIVAPRLPEMDVAAHPRAWLKTLMFLFPSSWLPKAKQVGMALRLDENGKIVESLHDAEGRTLFNISSVRERDGYLYFGHIYHKATKVGKLALPKQSPTTSSTTKPTTSPTK